LEEEGKGREGREQNKGRHRPKTKRYTVLRHVCRVNDCMIRLVTQSFA
jgi:hypothetical protein